jgi:hypothetical protein
VRANNRSEYAFSLRASIGGAWIIIITYFVAVDASFDGITLSDGAFISIIANYWFVLNSVFNGTEISCTSIMVIKLSGRERSVDASDLRMASINSARIFVVTIDRSINTFFLVLRATINSAQVMVVAMFGSNIGENASFQSIARFVGARIFVITNNEIVMNLSSFEIAPVSGTCIVIINWYSSEDTFSSFLVTFICGAWILIVTDNRSSDYSSVSIASNNFTKIGSDKRNQRMNTTNFSITGIFSAFVLIVAIN